MALNKDPKSGKWIAQVGSGSKGTRLKRRFSYKNDAEAWLRETEKTLLLKEKSPNLMPDMPIQNLLSLYLDSLQETTLKHRKDIRNSVSLF